MIALLVATRGVTFTKTDIIIDEIRDFYDCKVFRTFDKKIPDAQNYLVDEALKTEAEYMLFIEEDNVPTLSQIQDMVNKDVDICFVDYGVNGTSCSMKDGGGEVLWCGLGCTLVKRKVFEKLKKPYFRNDKSFRLNDMEWIDVPMKYGGQDIWLFIHAREAGFKIHQIPGECQHLGIKSLGKSEVNNGLHDIYSKSRIINYQVLEEVFNVWQAM